MTTSTNDVTVTRMIAAPAPRLFGLLTDPVRHATFDGSGMLRDARSPQTLRAVGDAFVMAMHNDEMGDYEMTCHVVEFEPDRRIAWEPVLTAASRREDATDIGRPAHQRWGYTLQPEGPDATSVTETFDCSRSPAWLQRAVRGGARWVDTMRLSLERLEAVVTRVPPGSRSRRAEPVPSSARCPRAASSPIVAGRVAGAEGSGASAADSGALCRN
jgi:uncharacterized protein YndB with AHSA1/START domain